MASLHLKNVPDHVHQRLIARARRNRRSLNSELLYLLEQVLNAPILETETSSTSLTAARRCRSLFSGMLTLAEMEESRGRDRP